MRHTGSDGKGSDDTSFTFELPDHLKAAIQEEARVMAKTVIEREFKRALEKEVEAWFNQHAAGKARKMG